MLMGIIGEWGHLQWNTGEPLSPPHDFVSMRYASIFLGSVIVFGWNRSFLSPRDICPNLAIGSACSSLV
jgi:hypothetical protein